DFDEVVVEPETANEQVIRLDVPVHQREPVSFLEGIARPTQEMDDTLWRLGAEALDQDFDIDTVEQFHGVIEKAVLGDSEIEQVYGVGGSQRRRGSRLLLEPPSDDGCLTAALGHQHFGPHQLDGGLAGQHAMPAAPYFPHPALSKQRLELVAAQVCCAL